MTPRFAKSLGALKASPGAPDVNPTWLDIKTLSSIGFLHKAYSARINISWIPFHDYVNELDSQVLECSPLVYTNQT